MHNGSRSGPVVAGSWCGGDGVAGGCSFSLLLFGEMDLNNGRLDSN